MEGKSCCEYQYVTYFDLICVMYMHLKTPIVFQGYIEEKWIKEGRVDFCSHLQDTGCSSQRGVVENRT